MNVNFGNIYGNRAVLETLAGRVRTGTAAHAYLLEGAEGSGKHTLAMTLAAALCCTDGETVPCGQCSACRKILAKPCQSPDVYVLGDSEADDAKKTRSIGVAEVRELKSDVYIKPNDLERKIYVISHADRMTPQAQNALLKILEEPPETVIFFLLCENRAALLPTVRSRMQMLSMERFRDEVLLELLKAHEPAARALDKRDPEKLALFVRLAEGAYGRAAFYLQADGKQLQTDPAYDAHAGAEECLSCLFSAGETGGGTLLGTPVRVSRTELSLILARCGDTRERLRGLLDALCAAVRDLTACAVQSTGELLFYPHREQPEALAERCSTYALMRLYRSLAALREQLDSNPNVNLVQTAAAMALYELVNGR